MQKTSPVLLRRVPRTGPQWHGGTSHIGGLPSLGDQPWPKDASGKPLKFLAQIDLAQLNAEQAETGLPSDGYLLFFAKTALPIDDHKVLHVPANSKVAKAPDDLPALFGPGTFEYVFPFATTIDKAPSVLPRWPMSFHALPEGDAEDRESALAALAATLGQQEQATSTVTEFRKALLAEGLPEHQNGLRWNHSILLFIDGLAGTLHDIPAWLNTMHSGQTKAEEFRASLMTKPGALGRLLGMKPRPKSADAKARIETSLRSSAFTQDLLSKLETDLPEYHAFVAETVEWADGLSPWDEITPETLARFEDIVRRRDTFETVYTNRYSPLQVGSAVMDTLRMMIHGPDELWSLLPEGFRNWVNQTQLFPTALAGRHQMFGRGRDIQGGVWEEEASILLLQLTHDDLIWWNQGDVGATWAGSILKTPRKGPGTKPASSSSVTDTRSRADLIRLGWLTLDL